MKRTFTTLAAAMMMAIPASLAQAELSPADIDTIDGQSGIRVVSSDGAFVGLTNGVNVRGERTRMFVIPRAGSIFRHRGRDVTITALTDNLTLRGDTLVLAADELRLKIKAKKPASDDSGPIEITLLNRR